LLRRVLQFCFRAIASLLFIIQQRSPKINTFTNKRSRLSTNQQHQTAITPNLNYKRSPKISTLPRISDRPSKKHQTAIAISINE
ncbi:MAG: hypothetical protein ACK52Q_01030, partial [Pseudanabaena sp.]